MYPCIRKPCPHLEVVDRRRRDDRVVETKVQEGFEVVYDRLVMHSRRGPVRWVEDSDEVDPVESRKYAGVVSAHDAQAEDTGT